MRLIIISLLIGCTIPLLSGCGQESLPSSPGVESAASEENAAEALTDGKSATQSLADGEITKENLPIVSAALKAAGLSRVDIFEDWVKAYADGIPEDTESSGFADPDCRMTVMLLAGDSIKYTDVEKEYKGTYLMFDMDAIENQEDYSVLKDQAKLFTTLFGEKQISKGDFSKALPETWKRYGITFENNKASIISIVFRTLEGNEAYVGHTGLLVRHDNGYLFVEKIAFGEPYRVTKVENAKALIDIFSARPDYMVEADEPAPLVYENDTLLGELNRQKN